GPVLIDFGVAQELDDARLTSHGFVMGTPGYLAPEMLDGAPPGPGADWWGWAAALVFAGTGRAPFGVRPLEAVLERVRTGTPDLAGLGPLTARVLGGALQVDPARRLAASEVVAGLAAAAEAGEELQDAAPVTQMLSGAGSGSGAGPGGTAVLGARTASALTRDVPLDPAPHASAPSAGTVAAGAGATMPVTVGPVTAGPVPAGHMTEDGAGTAPGWPAVAGSLDDQHDDQHDGEFDAGYQRPAHPHRPFAVLALAVPAALAGTLYPGVTAIAVLAVLWVVRTVAVTSDRLHSGRETRGVRRSDPWRHGVLMPWYLLRAAVGLLPSVLVAASSAVMLLGVLWWVLQTDRWIVATGGGTAQLGPGAVPGTHTAGWVVLAALGLAAAVVLALLWFGPAARRTRQGARIVLGTLAPGGRGTLIVIVVALVLTALVVLGLAVDAPVHWWPFHGAPARPRRGAPARLAGRVRLRSRRRRAPGPASTPPDARLRSASASWVSSALWSPPWRRRATGRWWCCTPASQTDRWRGSAFGSLCCTRLRTVRRARSVWVARRVR
ncbi:MAG: protein kinase domain-containing protein, partial [Cellulomonadaceae bacterium]